MSTTTESRRLASGIEQLGLEASARQLERLLAHVSLIRKWSGAYNLVAASDLPALVERHVLDSLAIHPWVRQGPVLDVGSGAGFPGLPLAILDPTLEMTLLDSSGKRARFLRHVIRTLQLDAVQVVHGRVEQYRPERLPATIVSRAFASLADFARCCEHLLSAATRLVAIKGRHPSAELDGLPGWVRTEQVLAYRVPHLQADRHVVIMSHSPGVSAESN